MHAEHPTAANRTRDGNGIVEIARIHRVDGYGEAVADITTQWIGQCAFDIDRKRRSLVDRCLRIAVHEPITGHDALDAQTRLVGIADAPLERHHAGLRARRIVHDARGHDVAGLHTQTPRGIVGWQHEEILLDARVKRAHGTQRPRRLEHAHNRRDGTVDHVLHDGTTGSALAAMQAHIYAISRHGLTHGARPQAIHALGRLNLSAGVIHPHRSRQPWKPPRPSGPTPSVLRMSTSTHAFLSITG